MSKSEDSPQGTIVVLDDPKAITKKIKSAVTDSDTEVRHDRDAKPGVSNLIEIYAAVTGQTIAERREASSTTAATARSRSAVAEAVVEYLRPVQERYAALDGRPRRGRPSARDRRRHRGAIADPVLARAMAAAGLLPRRSSTASAGRQLLGSFHGDGCARFAGQPAAPLTSTEVLAAEQQAAHRSPGARRLQHDRLARCSRRSSC